MLCKRIVYVYKCSSCFWYFQKFECNTALTHSVFYPKTANAANLFVHKVCIISFIESLVVGHGFKGFNGFTYITHANGTRALE